LRLHDIGSSTQTTHSTPYPLPAHHTPHTTEPPARPFSDPSEPNRHVKPSLRPCHLPSSRAPTAGPASLLLLTYFALCTSDLYTATYGKPLLTSPTPVHPPQNGLFQLHMPSGSGRHGDDGLCSVVRGLLEHCNNAFGCRVADNHIARQRHVHNRLLRDRHTTGELWLL
jgi:hypothetical protein